MAPAVVRLSLWLGFCLSLSLFLLAIGAHW